MHHGGEGEQCVGTGIGCCYTMPWIAFYADCEHEVQMVRTGYCVALEYMLLRVEEGPALKPPSQASASDAFAELGTSWSTGGFMRAPNKLIYFLKHRYTRSGLSWAALKGMDAVVAQALVQSAAFDLYLVSTKLTELGDDECDGVDESEFEVEGWIPPDGQLNSFGGIRSR